jgi:hypothetical protein
VQFLLWGGGVEPLGLYVGDLKKANIPATAKATSIADRSAASREERRVAREQARAEAAEAAAAAAATATAAAPEVDEVPADTLAVQGQAGGTGMGSADGMAAAAVQIGNAAGGSSAGGSASAGGADAAASGQLIPGLPAVRGTASWKGEDGQVHTTGYTMQGESVVYDDPNFVPFKKSEEAKAKRMNMDLSSLP